MSRKLLEVSVENKHNQSEVLIQTSAETQKEWRDYLEWKNFRISKIRFI